MKRRCREVFQSNGAAIERERDGIIFICRREVKPVKRQGVVVIKAKDNVLAFAVVVDKSIVARVAPE